MAFTGECPECGSTENEEVNCWVGTCSVCKGKHVVSELELEHWSLDRRIAHEIMGMVACDKWEGTNLGSAGGPAIIKRCEHALDGCYDVTKWNNAWDGLSGVPPFSSDSKQALRAWEKIRMRLPEDLAPGKATEWMWLWAADGVHICIVSGLLEDYTSVARGTVPLAIARAGVWVLSQ